MSETLFNSEEKAPVSIFNYAYKWALIGSIAYIVKLYSMYFYNGNHYNPQAGGIIAGLFACTFVLLNTERKS